MNNSPSCPSHPEYQITNICTIQACIEPLCPECIPRHIAYHAGQGQVPQIENIQTVRSQQKSMVVDILQKLREQHFLLTNLDVKMHLQNALQKLGQSKLELIRVIDQIFQGYEQELKAHFEGIKLQADDNIKEIVEKQIQRMVNLNNQLGNQDFVKGVLQVFIEGIGPAIHQKLEKECSETLGVIPDVIVNSNVLQNLKYHVEPYITIKSRSRKVFQQAQGPERDREIVNQLIGQKDGAAGNQTLSVTGSNKPPLVNQVYLRQGSLGTNTFKAPQFVQSPSELGPIETPLQPIYIEVEQLQEPFIVTFFEDQKRMLIYHIRKQSGPYYLQSQKISEFQEFSLNLDKRVAVGHQCVVYGKDIFLLGGIQRDIDRSASVATVMRLDLKNKTLVHHTNMIHRRQGFGACVLENQIFVCGGSYSDNEEDSINTMERFDGVKWTPLRSCTIAATGLCLSVINRDFLIKVGGIDKEYNQVKGLEVYSIRSNSWFELQVFDFAGNFWKEVPVNGGCVAINKSEIMIFGGQVGSDYVDHAWVVSLDGDSYSIKSSQIRRIHSLPCLGQVGQTAGDGNTIYSFISEGASLVGSKKKLVQCSSDRWNYIQNINE